MDSDGWLEVEDMACEHYMQHCLQKQLLETRDELCEIAKQYWLGQYFVFEGMPDLVMHLVSGALSSAESRECLKYETSAACEDSGDQLDHIRTKLNDMERKSMRCTFTLGDITRQVAM